MPKPLWRVTLCHGAILFAVPLARADNYPRQPGVDALHYKFRVTLTDANDEIDAEADVTLRFVQANVAQVFLDLATPRDGKGMTVTALTCGSAACTFEHSGDRLSIRLSATPAAGERREFHIAYHGMPATGLHIAKSKFGDRTFFFAFVAVVICMLLTMTLQIRREEREHEGARLRAARAWLAAP